MWGAGKRSAELLDGASPQLWGCVLAFFVLGDLTTTAAGVATGGVVEVGPLAAPLVRRGGVGAMALLKIAVVGFSLVLWRVLPRPQAAGVPLGLAVTGALVTAWNGVVLAVALS